MFEAEVLLLTKRWWSSRTILFNAAAAGLVIAEHQLNFLQPLVPVNVYAAIAFALPIVNGLLRFLTTTGIR